MFAFKILRTGMYCNVGELLLIPTIHSYYSVRSICLTHIVLRVHVKIL